ncbi:SRPBCC family protein [Lysinibacillus telephonicus]|uniref:SRPBCC family protein n=1 Tax=Lysinibacillus telephonicus TaxID=1714840 RepID=UPI00397C7309
MILITSSSFQYDIYIATTPEKLWEALTNSEFTEKYWFGRKIQSDWKEGSLVTFFDENGNITDDGTLIAYEPHQLLLYTFLWVEDQTQRECLPKVTFKLQPMESTVKLTLQHEDLLPSDFFDESEGFQGINNGWPAIISNLKSLLETGKMLPALTFS